MYKMVNTRLSKEDHYSSPHDPLCSSSGYAFSEKSL